MERSSFLDFDPVPVRNRRDGWDEARQRRFIVQLARGLGVKEAAASVGRSRQTAYALRSRAGAAGFACAWDQAVGFVERDDIRGSMRTLGLLDRMIDRKADKADTNAVSTRQTRQFP